MSTRKDEGFKALKGIDPDAWAMFKAVAAYKKITMGDLFNRLVHTVGPSLLKGEVPLPERQRGIQYSGRHVANGGSNGVLLLFERKS